ncbi:MAG TPA: hypothetical protein VEQ41_05470, partial [Solirubrobacterales bacterium]|nr:hypothetical protein [Solirubrobacterales bacterium]
MSRSRRLLLALASAVATLALAAAPASADFGLSDISVSFTEADGSQARKAGSHPFEMTTTFKVNTVEHPDKPGVQVVDGALRNLDVTLPVGFAGNPTAAPRCETIDFLTLEVLVPACDDATAVGTLRVEVGGATGIVGEETVPVYSLLPSPGVAAKLGFYVAELPVTIDISPAQSSPYNVVASLRNTSQIAEVLGSEFTIWGNPADPRHNSERGECVRTPAADTCPTSAQGKPLITLPRTCEGPLTTTFHAVSWWSGNRFDPGPPASFHHSVQTPGMIDCSALRLSADLQVRPTSAQAESATGLEADLTVTDEDVNEPSGRVDSDVSAVLVELPEGITANPSFAAGLATCSSAQLAAETLTSAPGQGCPLASKIGTVEATTPILEDTVLRGALYIAPQDDPNAPGPENPFDSLLAMHLVVKDPTLGLLVRQSGLIEPNRATGQLISIFDDLPPFPLGEVRLRLREGGRSPLITPPRCGPYTTFSELFPSADPEEVLEVPSTFQITSGVGGAPCPSGSPFDPGFSAGTASNSAGSFSPFHMRLTRRDGDQDLTRFDAVLPPGVLAKLAGVGKCPDAQIALAKTKTGKAEIAQPSCPASSRIGGVWGGAGVGSQLTYVPGDLYLAGPVGKAPLSVVGIVPAVAGPFDVGTVVVRQALRVNPRSATAEVDGAASDPIPHILEGIPLKVRDIRVDVDRPNFTLNPTGCEPSQTLADIWGGGTNVFSLADDSPVRRHSRFQAANCSRLGFKPRLAIKLKGGTKRGAHPALIATYRPRPGDANLASVSTRLPRSAFLDQAHIRTICTRVQFAAEACPPGAIYGTATATTPLLDEPLSGPVYLRSSDNELPDMVLDLHGLVDVEVSARIDSVKGGIRASFTDAPDAPVTKVVLRMRGGKKGLVVNSTNLCARRNRARAVLGAQSGKRLKLRPVVRPSGCKG